MTVKIDKINGLRNNVSPERFDNGDLTAGSNVDIDVDGKASRRDGVSRVVTGATTSLWSDGENAYCVQSGALKRITDALTTDTVVTGVGASVSFASINSNVYWSDGVTKGVLYKNKNRPWGITPPVQPAVAAILYGGLSAGTYGVTAVYQHSNGSESGAPRASYITLADNQGLTISGLSASSNPNVVGTTIYITRPNGKAFFAAATVDDALSSVVITSNWLDSLQLRTQFKSAPPAGRIVFYFAGRMYVANGGHIFYSDPLEFELFDIRSNFLSFSSAVTIAAPVGSGLFVCTAEETVFLSGRDPVEFVAQPIANYGAVPGTLVYPRTDKTSANDITGRTAMWMSKQGVCVGLPSGEMVNVTSDRYSVPEAASGAGLFKMQGGNTPQFLVNLFS
jgi:hypothetical protein